MTSNGQAATSWKGDIFPPSSSMVSPPARTRTPRSCFVGGFGFDRLINSLIMIVAKKYTLVSSIIHREEMIKGCRVVRCSHRRRIKSPFAEDGYVRWRPGIGNDAAW